MKDQQFPAGWDEQRVKKLLADLDARTDDEWIAADEAAAAGEGDQAVITVPAALLPEIRRLLAAHKSARDATLRSVTFLPERNSSCPGLFLSPARSVRKRRPPRKERAANGVHVEVAKNESKCRMAPSSRPRNISNAPVSRNQPPAHPNAPIAVFQLIPGRHAPGNANFAARNSMFARERFTQHRTQGPSTSNSGIP
jgi:hypothetical protein